MKAPQIDHQAYQEKVKQLPDAALQYIIKDCQEAIAAMPTNPKNGYYSDEICYCVNEINRRNKGLSN